MTSTICSCCSALQDRLSSRWTRSIGRATIVSAICGMLIPIFAVTAQQEENKSWVGSYRLVSVDGKKMPARVKHGEVEIEIRSGVFVFNSEGTCGTTTVFGRLEAEKITRKVSATYEHEKNKFTMKWKGAGKTVGTLSGDTFTMINEGTSFEYKKISGLDLLSKLVGTWDSVQLDEAGKEIENSNVQLTYSKTLGGKYLQETGSANGKQLSLMLYTFDKDSNVFRAWRFSTDNPPQESKGNWDSKTKSLVLTLLDKQGQDLTMQSTHQLISDDEFEWSFVAKDKSRKVVYKLQGRAKRSK